MSITEPHEPLNFDFKQQSQFVTFFNLLPEKPASTIRFFSHTDFYSLHGTDASAASTYTGNLIKYMGDDSKLAYVVLRKTQFDKYVRELLIVKQYRVEVYVKKAPNKVTEWLLEFKGSPGNISQFEDIIFDGAYITHTNYVMGVKIVTGRSVAIACVNSTELKFQLCEINDNECFTELESVIAQIGPRECVIPHGDSFEIGQLKKLLERNSVLVAGLKKSDFQAENVVQDLDRLLFFPENAQRNAMGLPQTKLGNALGCLNAVIKFLNLTADEHNFNQFKLSTMDIHQYVRLDNAALFSLNILPNPGTNTTIDSSLLQNKSNSFCLRSILDTCVTAQGKRLLDQWIKQPLKDINLITERLDIVESLVKDPNLRQTLQNDILPRSPDLLILSKKLSSKKGSLQDCYKVYQIVGAVPKLLTVLKEINNSCLTSALVRPLEEVTKDLVRFQDMIEEFLDLDLVNRGEFLVKHNFSKELNELYRRKLEIEEKMQKLLRKASADLNFEEDKTIKLECNDQHGYFFRVTLKEEHALRRNSSYQILDAIKGGVRFTNDKLSDLNCDYRETRTAYEDEQKEIIKEVLDVAAGYGDCLRGLNVLIATVDVLVSFANVSILAKIPYVRPKIKADGPMKIFKLRHPCIEQQDHISFIPNDVDFDHNDKTLHIITGPNMCGKSTFIRSVGVCVLMAQIGCFVPCRYAEIPLVDAILARVGAEDFQLKGLSTFMVEMLGSTTITESATSNSLVIIDELGRGTSTYDGCGIAFAISEYLAKEVKCFTLIATHFHEITRLADMYPCVSNKHVTAVTTESTITPLFQVRDGVCDNSYGVHCARMVDFPNDVIEAAVEYQKKLEGPDGMTFIKNFEERLKRDIVEEGDTIIDNYLDKIKDLDKLSDEELLQQIQTLGDELKEIDNPFIKSLLS